MSLRSKTLISQLEKNFEKIGAEVKIVSAGTRGSRRSALVTPVSLDVITEKGKEVFEISLRRDERGVIDLSVLEVRRQDRHLVLLARQLDRNGRVINKDHFLCGHDERHLFVAQIAAVSSVAAAKDSLKPQELREKESGLDARKRNRRKTTAFKRQGEWFFVPAVITVDWKLVRKNEPLSRGGGSKPHMAQFAFRTGGEMVKVCSQRPDGLTQAEYKELIETNPDARHWSWRDMQRNAQVYVRGKVSHPDHAALVLNGWYRVLMNSERRTEAVVFLD
jgi:hypothetical protein